MSKTRDYKNATAYENQPEQVKKRELRNAARAKFEKAGKVSKGDGRDVDHIHMLKFSSHPTKTANSDADLRAITAHQNRSWRKGKHGY
jgi:hypothetical protein